MSGEKARKPTRAPDRYDAALTEAPLTETEIRRMQQEIAELRRQVAALVAIVEALRKLADERAEGAWS